MARIFDLRIWSNQTGLGGARAPRPSPPAASRLDRVVFFVVVVVLFSSEHRACRTKSGILPYSLHEQPALRALPAPLFPDECCQGSGPTLGQAFEGDSGRK